MVKVVARNVNVSMVLAIQYPASAIALLDGRESCAKISVNHGLSVKTAHLNVFVRSKTHWHAIIKRVIVSAGLSIAEVKR